MSATSSAISIQKDTVWVLSAKVYIPLEKHADFFALFKPAYDAVLAEPECRFFLVTTNPQDPECFRWIEGWSKDPEWVMNEQLKKEYYEPYRTKTAEMYSKPM